MPQLSGIHLPGREGVGKTAQCVKLPNPMTIQTVCVTVYVRLVTVRRCAATSARSAPTPQSHTSPDRDLTSTQRHRHCQTTNTKSSHPRRTIQTVDRPGALPCSLSIVPQAIRQDISLIILNKLCAWRHNIPPPLSPWAPKRLARRRADAM